jgi:hypothetical protein
MNLTDKQSMPESSTPPTAEAIRRQRDLQLRIVAEIRRALGRSSRADSRPAPERSGSAV